MKSYSTHTIRKIWTAIAREDSITPEPSIEATALVIKQALLYFLYAEQGNNGQQYFTLDLAFPSCNYNFLWPMLHGYHAGGLGDEEGGCHLF